MAVVCGGNTFASFVGSAPGGCTAVPLDTVKIWVSLEQAALLSGKNLKISFQSCMGGGFGLTEVDLLQ
jgi:hypothetical protein